MDWVSPLGVYVADGGFGGSARLLQEDIEPLRTRLKTDGEAELDEIHHACLQQLQYELQRVLRRGEGETAFDYHVSALVRLQPRTYCRLFGDRLDFLARRQRSGPPACRTYKFSTTASYYKTVWPRSRLSLLAASLGVNGVDGRRILAVEARCGAGSQLRAGTLVYVLTDNKVYRPGASRLYDMTADHYTITQQIEVRYTTKTAAPRCNLRHRGARMLVTAKQWPSVRSALPLW
eukprot:COSAG03_NODE_642_length_6535_cov_21.663611_5_plen_234_part_00